MHFASNIKFLRKRAGTSQEEVAEQLQLKRPSLSGYENGSAEPNFETLLRFAAYFHIPTDVLLKKDLNTLSAFELAALDNEEELDLSGRKLRVIATTVDPDGQDYIELVPIKARAGYTAGYGDMKYIKELSQFKLPFLDKEKKYRSFQIEGDSMPPVPSKAWVTGEYVQDWTNIKDKLPYIIVTREEGIVFKVVFNKIRQKGSLLLVSTNTIYEPYEVKVEEIVEIWKFVNYISEEFLPQ